MSWSPNLRREDHSSLKSHHFLNDLRRDNQSPFHNESVTPVKESNSQANNSDDRRMYKFQSSSTEFDPEEKMKE
jgi:hypothetical protein